MQYEAPKLPVPSEIDAEIRRLRREIAILRAMKPLSLQQDLDVAMGARITKSELAGPKSPTDVK